MKDAAVSTSTPTHNPPKWLNVFMVWFLKTPGLQRAIGKGVALLTITGRKSGKEYVIPVSYARFDGGVMMLTRAARTWWRNLRGGAPVQLRLAGEKYVGTAVAHVGGAEDIEAVTEFLAKRPYDAKAYGVALGPDRRPEPADVSALVGQVVVILVELEEH